MSIFGFDGAAAIRVVNTSGMAAVTSRTYNLTSGGTFGQFVGGVISHTAIQPGQEGRIIQLTHNRSTTSGFRTNIGFVNATGSSITVQVALYRADGSYLGTKSYPLAALRVPTGGQDLPESGQRRCRRRLRGPDHVHRRRCVLRLRRGDRQPHRRPHLHHAVHPQRGLVASPTHADPDHDGHNHAIPPTPTATPTPTSTPTTTVNLAPYQPSGWSGPLVVSGTTGTRTSGGLTGGGATYFDWAVANYGPDDAVFPAGEAIARIALDGASRVNFFNNTVYTLEAGFYASYDDYQIDGISAGQHTATLLADPGHVIGESDESDNNSDYVGSWSSKSESTDIRVKVPTARIRVAPIPGWQPETAKHRYDPIGVLWLGAPPLQPGPLAIAPTKATAVDNAMYIPAAAQPNGSPTRQLAHRRRTPQPRVGSGPSPDRHADPRRGQPVAPDPAPSSSTPVPRPGSRTFSTPHSTSAARRPSGSVFSRAT